MHQWLGQHHLAVSGAGGDGEKKVVWCCSHESGATLVCFSTCGVFVGWTVVLFLRMKVEE